MSVSSISSAFLFNSNVIFMKDTCNTKIFFSTKGVSFISMNGEPIFRCINCLKFWYEDELPVFPASSLQCLACGGVLEENIFNKSR